MLTYRLAKELREFGWDVQDDTCSRGQIYFVSQAKATGSEQAGRRPAIIVSNDAGNLHSTVVEVVFLTTRTKHDLPTHVPISSVKHPSIALCEQIQTVDKERLSKYIGTVSRYEMEMINEALAISLGLSWKGNRRDGEPSGNRPALDQKTAAGRKQPAKYKQTKRRASA